MYDENGIGQSLLAYPYQQIREEHVIALWIWIYTSVLPRQLTRLVLKWKCGPYFYRKWTLDILETSDASAWLGENRLLLSQTKIFWKQKHWKSDTLVKKKRKHMSPRQLHSTTNNTQRLDIPLFIKECMKQNAISRRRWNDNTSPSKWTGGKTRNHTCNMS